MTLLTLLQSQGALGGITGAGNITLGALTVVGAGTVTGGAITGAGNITLDAITVAGAGTVSGGPITGSGNITLGALTVMGAATLGPSPIAPLTRGGFYTKEDRKRHKRLSEIAVQRRNTQRDEQDAFRSALEAAYDAALGLVDEPAAETRAEVREAIAEASQAAPEPYRAEMHRLRDLARQAETLAQIERVVTRIAAIQARAQADDDDDETVLMLIG